MPVGRETHRFGWAAATPALRDRRVVNWLPLGWFNATGGLTLGLQSRSNYLGRFDLGTAQLTWPTGLGRDASAGAVTRLRPDWYVAMRDPVRLRAPRRHTEVATWWLEGRTGARLAGEVDRSPMFEGPERRSAGADLTVMVVTDARYLDRRRWDDVNTAELTAWAARSRDPGEGEPRASARVALTLGEWFKPSYPPAYYLWVGPGPPPDPIGTRRLRGASYAHGVVEVGWERPVGAFTLRWRTVAAGVLGGTSAPLQRRIGLAGADPYETFRNPFLRSGGAFLAREGVHYQAAGGLGLRGFAPTATATWGAAVNLEAGLRVLERPRLGAFSAVTVAAFADAALLDHATLGRDGAADAGIGVRASHRIGPTRFVTRVDLPLLVSRPARAVSGAAGDGAFKFRWVWSLEEAF